MWVKSPMYVKNMKKFSLPWMNSEIRKAMIINNRCRLLRLCHDRKLQSFARFQVDLSGRPCSLTPWGNTGAVTFFVVFSVRKLVEEEIKSGIPSERIVLGMI